jgi:predicted metal-dependent phosphoesterase TrpH
LAIPGRSITDLEAKNALAVDGVKYQADLHIHTILSPCTELTEMSPHAIVGRACHNDLDIIAICDHNSCVNVATIQKNSLHTDLEY